MPNRQETREEREERERREREDWTPADPLPNEEDEAEVDQEARARARLDYLREQYGTKKTKSRSRRSGGGGLFRGRD